MTKMKLGTKIVLGFSILIVIALFLGGLAVYQMKNVEGDSVMLANEYVPEVDIATELRGAANRVMYEMRGYGFTEDQAYYKNAQKELAAVDKSLADARTLEKNSPNLKKLKGQIESATKAIEDYKRLVKQTYDTNAKLDANRKALDESAVKYMENSNSFLAGQNAKLKVDLKERQEKIALVTQLVNLGSTARVSNFKSQALNDPALMENAIKQIGETAPVIASLRKITRDKEDIKRIDLTETAAKGYQTSMRNFLTEYKKGAVANTALLSRYRKAMDTNAGVYVKNCASFLEGQ